MSWPYKLAAFTDYVEPVQLYVMLTCAMVWYLSNKEKLQHRIIRLIVTACMITETLATFLLWKAKNISLLYSVSVLAHHSLWIFLLLWTSQKMKLVVLILTGYITIGLMNLFFIEGTSNFNYGTFIIGAFIYILIFIGESFYRLKNEDLDYFRQNDFLLLASPLLFFFGLSFVFGFRSGQVSDIIIFNNTDLYDIIQLSVNLIYYSLIIVYMIREKKLAHG